MPFRSTPRSGHSTATDTHERDSDYSLRFNRWLLKPIGAWPESLMRSASENILSKILRLTCYFLIAITLVPNVLYILFEEKSIRLKLRAIGPASHWLMGAINYSSLLYQRKRIGKSVEHMQADWRSTRSEHERKTMLRKAKVGRLIASICALVMHGGVFCYNVSVAMQSILIVAGNETISLGRLPCPAFNAIIDTRVSPVYEVVLVLQFMSAAVVTDATVGACALAAVFAMHCCGQLNVVMSRLEKIEDTGKHGDILRQRLANLIERHLRALRFLSRMEIIMRQVCFVELFGCTFNLCMIGYYIMTEWHVESTNTMITYFVILASMIFNIFIFCYIGDLVTEQCRKVGEVAYVTNWYRLPRNIALGLILIILRSSVVIKITAGKIFHMSIPTFGDVLKTSLVYLNMLRTLTT